MSKLKGLIIAATALLASASADAEPMSANAADCPAGTDHYILVHTTGFKSRSGTLRIQLYGGDPDRYFEKRAYLERIEVPTARADEVCIAVPKAGLYALSVRHDLNGNGKSDLEDGGGISGNPDLSLIDLFTRRKPPAAKVQFRVGDSPARVNILLNYVQGGSFKPLQSAER